MSRKIVTRLLWAATLGFWAFIFVMTHIPQQRLPDVPVSDKGTHVITFAVLGSMLYATLWHSRPNDWSATWKIPLILTLYGAFDEATQPLAKRSGELADWYADVAGALLAVALWTGVRLLARRPHSMSSTLWCIIISMSSANPPLFAPWRMDYIRSVVAPAPDEPCFICAAVNASSQAERRDRLVLWSSDHCIVMINRYPYTNGHLLIAPKAHKPEPEDLSEQELADVNRQTIEAIKLLKRAQSPQGFNIGINLGKCAGAGLPGHIHQHVVPRWNGDTNFMSVVGEVRVVPQAMSQLYDELSKLVT